MLIEGGPFLTHLHDCSRCRNGLRSVPTFVVNILTQHGNILVYLKLPDWVTDWSTCLVEKEDDAPDVVALKVCQDG